MTALPGDVTQLLVRLQAGDPNAAGELVPIVYKELRRLAAHLMRQERSGHTLQPTALVHEAYLSLVHQDRATWQNRAQFMAVSAHIMRRIILEYARRRAAVKRTNPDALPPALAPFNHEQVLAVDEALTHLAALSPSQARIAELRYFAGLSVEETAEALSVSPRTVKREWAVAKAFLRTELSPENFE
jgi:RNA polymerase sigma factor (TIGR02999 family)